MPRGGCIAGGTPLDLAVIFGKWRVANRLLDAGATLDPRNDPRWDEAVADVAGTPNAHFLLLQARLHRITEDHERALAASERAVKRGIEEVGSESSDLVPHRELLILASLGRTEDALREHDTMARVLRAAVRRGEWLEPEAGLTLARVAKAEPEHPRLQALVTEARRWTDAIDIESTDEAELLDWLRARPPLPRDRLAE